MAWKSDWISKNIFYEKNYLTRIKLLTKIFSRYSIAFPSHLIPLLEDMFTDYEEDSLIPDSMPNLIFNDNDEWENIQNSKYFSIKTISHSSFKNIYLI